MNPRSTASIRRRLGLLALGGVFGAAWAVGNAFTASAADPPPPAPPGSGVVVIVEQPVPVGPLSMT
jgi:hypothetical protein